MKNFQILNEFFKQRKRSFFKRQRNVDKELKGAFLKIKKEFEEHLQAINENTNEIQSNYECLCEIEAKIDSAVDRAVQSSDVEEEKLGTSNKEFDTDGDGLSDKIEIEVLGTDPTNPDTDGDGFADGYEVLKGFNPKGEGNI